MLRQYNDRQKGVDKYPPPIYGIPMSSPNPTPSEFPRVISLNIPGFGYADYSAESLALVTERYGNLSMRQLRIVVEERCTGTVLPKRGTIREGNNLVTRPNFSRRELLAIMADTYPI